MTIIDAWKARQYVPSKVPMQVLAKLMLAGKKVELPGDRYHERSLRADNG